jgi:DNA protecting protein DprA
MALASELPVGHFISLRGMQILRDDLSFLPHTILDLKACHAEGKTLGQFIKQLVAIGANVDGAKLAAACLTATKELELLQKSKINAISILDPEFPSTLSINSRPPAILYYRGDLALLKRAGVAIMGSRIIDKTDAIIAYKLAGHLSQQGFVVTSGMGAGVDSWAHKGTLRGLGKTIGVLPTALDHTAAVAPVALAIIEKGGLVVSPFPVGERVTKSNILYRNNVTVGLSVGTVIVKSDQYCETMDAALKTVMLERPLAVVAHTTWAQGEDVRQGYGGGFELVKQPKKDRLYVPEGMNKIKSLMTENPDLPLASGIWGSQDYPRLYSIMETSALNFPGISLTRPRVRDENNFRMVEPDMSAYEDAGGLGKSLHKGDSRRHSFGDFDPFSEDSDAPQATGLPSGRRQRAGMQ